MVDAEKSGFLWDRSRYGPPPTPGTTERRQGTPWAQAGGPMRASKWGVDIWGGGLLQRGVLLSEAAAYP